MTAPPRLSVQGLRFAYPGGPPLVDGVDFALAAGALLCLLGPNGAGKTTLLRCLLGFEPSASGRVCVDGRDLATLTPAQRARRVAYVPQAGATVFPFTAFDVVLMGRQPHLRFLADPDAADHRIAHEALERLGVGHLEGRAFDELSGGERQLVLVARALAQRAPLVLLDEPSSGLDLGNQVRVLGALRSLARDGWTVLLSTHRPEDAFALDARVALLAGGRLRGPAPAAELLTAAELSRLYGTPVELMAAPTGARACVPRRAEAEGGPDDEAAAPPPAGLDLQLPDRGAGR